MRIVIIIICLTLLACQPGKKMPWTLSDTGIGGKQFYQMAAGMDWKSRDSLVVSEVLKGNMPDFNTRFTAINVSVTDRVTGKKINATYYVSPDYLSIGNTADWARVNITPMASQKIADSLGCFLPTKKMVDDIFSQATVKLEPVPMFAFRDSTPTMWHHHLVIEGQRKGKKGLIAGIKKDLVITNKLSGKNDRVAIYGWHYPSGKPIQPLYTGHVNWYVDYSHGTRLVYRRIKVNGKWMDYREVLKDPVLRKLITDEDDGDNFYGYPY